MQIKEITYLYENAFRLQQNCARISIAQQSPLWGYSTTIKLKLLTKKKSIFIAFHYGSCANVVNSERRFIFYIIALLHLSVFQALCSPIHVHDVTLIAEMILLANFKWNSSFFVCVCVHDFAVFSSYFLLLSLFSFHYRVLCLTCSVQLFIGSEKRKSEKQRGRIEFGVNYITVLTCDAASRCI